MFAKCLWIFKTKKNDDLFSHNDLTNGNEQLEAKSVWLIIIRVRKFHTSESS